MKSLPRIVFAVSIVLLLWLVLFKTSLDIAGVLTNHHERVLSLIPFTGRKSEMIENFIVFIPFGLLIGTVFKRITLWQKLAAIGIFSLAVETIQYVLAIGVSDITDAITNTLGGLAGLLLYAFGKKYADTKKLDYFIMLAVSMLAVLLLLIRLFVLRVRY